MSSESGIVLTAASVGFLASATDAFVSGSSPSSAFSMLNMVQILLLLPLAGGYMPIKVIEFMYGISITLGSLTFLKLGSMIFVKDLLEWVTLDQDDEYLDIIGLESRSSFVNIYSIIGIMTIIPLIHL